MDKTLVEAIRYAVYAHQDVNESYDGAPYSLHLAMAAHYGDVFSYLLPPITGDARATNAPTTTITGGSSPRRMRPSSNYATVWPTPNTLPREAMRGWWRSIGRNSMLFWKNFPLHGKQTTHPCGKN